MDHTFGPDCPACGNGRRGARCDHHLYSKRYVRFVRAHREAFEASYLDGNPAASSNELERLSVEYKTLPPRHDCSCYPTHCQECLKLSRQRVNRPEAVVIGRTTPVHAPAPLTLMLDIEAGYAA